MPTYVVLLDWTEQGISNFKDTVDRYESAQGQFQEMGVSFKDVYWTLGVYDIVVVMEAPDDETVTAFALSLGSLGNVRTQTLRAFDADEMKGLIAKSG
jgi:uncharacterized protein with GYD domain